MSIPSLYSSRFNSQAYSEKIPGFMKEVFTGKKEPLNVLYIQGLDEHYDQTKKMSREHLDDRVRSGEIKIKDLAGDTAKDKLQALEQTLLKLRQQGRITNTTQIILSCKPGDSPGELDISRDGGTDVWNIKDVIDVVRGGRTEGQAKSSTDFNGTIHIFGHDHKDFPAENKKDFGNVLVHASGKFNWSHHHAFMIGHIVNASLNIKSEKAEEITKQVRDAIQPYAGYPIYRISNDKVKIKYPTFMQLDNAGKVDGYVAAIRNHKTPIDMLISCIERDSPKTLRIRLNTGELGDLINKNKKNIGDYEKKRLLAALAVSKKGDQKEKLTILTKEIGINFKGVKSKFEVGPSLEYEIRRNLNNLDPELIGFFQDLGFDTIPDDYLRDFLCRKIECGDFGKLIDACPNLEKRLREMGGEDIALLVNAAVKSQNCREVISDLGFAGVDFSLMGDDALTDLAENFKSDIGQYTRLFDGLIATGLDYQRLVDCLPGEEHVVYGCCSSLFHESDELKAIIKDCILNHPDITASLVQASISEVTHHKNIEPLKFLLDLGLDPNFKLDYGFTPLHKLCAEKNPDIAAIDLLLKKGADPMKKSDVGYFPLDVLNGNDHCDAEKMEEVFIRLVKDNTAILDELDAGKLRLIHRAAFIPNPVLLEIILKHYPDYVNNICDLSKMNPLHCAILMAVRAQSNKNFDKKKFDKALEVLLRAGVNLTAESEDVGQINGPSMKTAADYIKALKGYENYDLDKIQTDLLNQINAVQV